MKKINFASTIDHLIKNWYFPISALAFFSLNIRMPLGYSTVLLTISIIISIKCSSILDWLRKENFGIQILSVLTAAGICWNGVEHIGHIDIASILMAFFFTYVCIIFFWRKIIDIFKDTDIFNDIKISEIIIYTLLLAFSLCFMMAIFMHSQAFYGTEHKYDVIYTGDSPVIMKQNAYLELTHQENDLRQPLFAVFASPFVGVPYLLSKLLSVSASMQAILINSIQILLLFITNFMLARMMKLCCRRRIYFMLVASCSYTYLLFILMMEQYIVTYFWLIFYLYLVCEKGHSDRIALWGAGGTMLTNLIVLPFMSSTSPWENFKKWFADMIRYGLEFIGIILVFCRFDIVFNLEEKYKHLSSFTGKNIPLNDKIFQYTAFIRNYFLAPDAGVNFTAVDHVSWQLNPINKINYIGIIILLLVIISIILNRKQKSSLLAAGWIIFSAVILILLGWGTKENGLILYSLCFGWAFLVLLFQLIEQIEKMMHARFLLPVITIACSIILAIINFPAITEMVSFAVSYFPV